MKSPLKIILILAFLVLIGGIAYGFSSRQSTEPSEEIACTMDAKICPDGSSVGRVGPSCEFAACPTENSASTSAWIRFSDQGYSFQYPQTLGTAYISTVDWPPIVKISTEDYKCISAGSPEQRAGETREETLNGQKYCITQISEGAAGSIYSQYAVTTKGPKNNNGLINLTFSLRTPQCGNYPDPQQNACKNEVESFEVLPLVEQIVSSIETNE